MGGDYKFGAGLEQAIARAGARVRVGYPWWLRPWLARDVVAITLGRTIYLSRRAGTWTGQRSERLLRHELVHVRQVQEHGLVGFLCRYSFEFLRHLWNERSVARAYRLISFEVEAWAAEEQADV